MTPKHLQPLSFILVIPLRIQTQKTFNMPLTRSRSRLTIDCNESEIANRIETRNSQANLFLSKRRKITSQHDSNSYVKTENLRIVKNEHRTIPPSKDEEAPVTGPNSGNYKNPSQSTTAKKPAILARVRVRPENFTPAPDIEDAPPRPPSPQEVEHVLQRLQKFYRGELSTASHPKTKRRKDLLDSLFATILSQATSNTNSSRAFRSLKNKFAVWEHAMDAGAEAIEEQIRCGGLAKAKSKVIHHILRQLYEDHGVCSLEFLWGMSTDDAKKTLCSYGGVGPKTASCVLMFGMGRGEFPVDTHIRRIAARLNWMKLGSSAEKTYDVLNATLKDDIKYDLHVLLIEHGRKTCKARSPQCSRCPLSDMCPSRNVQSLDSSREEVSEQKKR